VVLGFSALIIDICSLLYKVLVHMDRSNRMTIIGSLVLLIGIMLVGGAVYYKTNQDKINSFLNKWRQRLGEWE